MGTAQPAMTLAELLDRHGETAEALELLLPVYGWFTEGFDTRDLRKAAQLIRRALGCTDASRSDATARIELPSPSRLANGNGIVSRDKLEVARWTALGRLD